MSTIEPGASPRAHELLAKRALEGLDPAEQAELAALGAADDDSYDLAAAAVVLATLPAEAMPQKLAARLLDLTTSSDIVPLLARRRRRGPGPGPNARSRGLALAGWLVAAASLLLALAALWWATRERPPRLVYLPPPPPVKAPVLTPAEERARLLAERSDAATLPFQATPDPAGRGASGDLVWSASAQRGFMRLVGVQPNDRQRFQYQLWIFDKERDQRYPVDGGVFDVESAGEVVVPITARLRVAQPALFAITVEPPGGVVVSKRERIVLTATPASHG